MILALAAGIVDKANELGLSEFDDKEKGRIGNVRHLTSSPGCQELASLS
jgi:hypothetical protein